MIRVNKYYYYQLGTILHPLTQIAEDSLVSSIVWQLQTARNWLNWLLDNQYEPIIVSKGAVLELLQAINSVIPGNYEDFPTIDPEKKITWLERYNITNNVSAFETVFAAELPTFDTYTIIKKGIYVTADLIERAEMAIEENIRSILPDNITRDFNQAGRCLALELPTAAGFHTMRAVEGVLRVYCDLAIRSSGSRKKRSRVMGQMIAQLRSLKEDAKVLDILDHIRDLHRNDLMHPEIFLDMGEALRLFDIAKSAICAMGDRIKILQQPLRGTTSTKTK